MGQRLHHQIRAQSHYLRCLIEACMPGEITAQVSPLCHQGIPGHGPIRHGGKLDLVLDGQIAGDELDQLVVAPMSVDQYQAPKPRDNHGFPQVGQDSVVGFGGE